MHFIKQHTIKICLFLFVLAVAMNHTIYKHKTASNIIDRFKERTLSGDGAALIGLEKYLNLKLHEVTAEEKKDADQFIEDQMQPHSDNVMQVWSQMKELNPVAIHLITMHLMKYPKEYTDAQLEDAAQYIIIARDMGHIPLAMIYEERKDKAKSLIHLKKAAYYGNLYAFYHAAALLALEKKYSESFILLKIAKYHLFEKANEVKIKNAINDALNNLNKKISLSQDQQKEIDQLIVSWKPKADLDHYLMQGRKILSKKR